MKLPVECNRKPVAFPLKKWNQPPFILAAIALFLFACSAGAVKAGVLPTLLSGGPEPVPASVEGGGETQSIDLVYNKLLEQGFSSIDISTDASTIYVRVAHSRISEKDRALGRAVRIINMYAPQTFKHIVICYQNLFTICSQCYSLTRDKADRYFKRLISKWQMDNAITEGTCSDLWPVTGVIRFSQESPSNYAKDELAPELTALSSPESSPRAVSLAPNLTIDTPPAERNKQVGSELKESAEMNSLVIHPEVGSKGSEDSASVSQEEERKKAIQVYSTKRIPEIYQGSESGSGHESEAKPQTANSHNRDDSANPLDSDIFSGFTALHTNNWQIKLNPVDIQGNLLNSADGDVYADMVSAAEVNGVLGAGISINGRIFARWFSPDTTAGDDNLYPVRSLIDTFREDNSLVLERLVLNYQSEFGDSGYINLSTGYLEEMYTGIASQFYRSDILDDFAMDLKVDWVSQRRPDSPYEWGDYDTVSATAGVYWYSPVSKWFNIAELQVGRFLAKDVGAVIKVGYRFDSGLEFKLWYSDTASADTDTIDGVGDTYQVAGISINLPLSSVRRRDTQKVYRLNYSADFSNAGQLINRPVDYSVLSAGSKTIQKLQNFGQ